MRAQLVGPNNTPASWAIVEVRINGRRLGRGVADRQGRLLVMFEYPAPARSAASPPNGSPPGGSAPSSSPPASPPGSPPSGLATPARRYRTPPLELVAFAGTWPSGSPPASPPSATAPEIPDLCRVLQQPPSRLWLRLSPPEPLPPLELAFGDEALLKSAGRSDLLIAP
jgi:hypothetical protein